MEGFRKDQSQENARWGLGTASQTSRGEEEKKCSQGEERKEKSKEGKKGLIAGPNNYRVRGRGKRRKSYEKTLKIQRRR